MIYSSIFGNKQNDNPYFARRQIHPRSTCDNEFLVLFILKNDICLNLKVKVIKNIAYWNKVNQQAVFHKQLINLSFWPKRYSTIGLYGLVLLTTTITI